MVCDCLIIIDLKVLNLTCCFSLNRSTCQCHHFIAIADGIKQNSVDPADGNTAAMATGIVVTLVVLGAIAVAVVVIIKRRRNFSKSK